MVSPLSLYAFAAVLVCLAGVVARLRRTRLGDALADGRAALLGTFVVLAAAIGLFALCRPLGAAERWCDAGSLVLVASPLGGALGLRSRGRRSMPRALLAAGVGLAGVALWLTLNFRGPRGGWTAIDVALVLPAAAIAVAAAACLGWWSKRGEVEDAALAADG